MNTYSIVEGKILKSIPINNEFGIMNFLEIDIMSFFGGFGIIKLYKIYQNLNSIELLIKMADKPFSQNSNEDDKINQIYQICSIMNTLHSHNISVNNLIIGNFDNFSMILELENAKYHSQKNIDKDSIIELCELLNPTNQEILVKYLFENSYESLKTILSAPIFTNIKSSNNISKKINPLKLIINKNLLKKDVPVIDATSIRNCIKIISKIMELQFGELPVSALMLAVEIFYRYEVFDYKFAFISSIISARIHSWDKPLTLPMETYKNITSKELTFDEIILSQFDMINKFEGKFVINLLYSKYCNSLDVLLSIILKPTYNDYINEFNSNLNEKLGNYSELIISNFI